MNEIPFYIMKIPHRNQPSLALFLASNMVAY